jgi:hypothetical protein
MPWIGLTLVHYVRCITQLTLRDLPDTSPNIMGRVATEDKLASKLPLNSRSVFQGEKIIVLKLEIQEMTKSESNFTMCNIHYQNPFRNLCK